MDTETPAIAARRALAGRLRAVVPVLLPRGPEIPVHPDLAADAAAVFERLTSAIEAELTDERVWLLLTALSATYPTQDEIVRVRRRFQLSRSTKLRLDLLDSALRQVQLHGTALASVDLIVGGVIADVDFSAKNELHTGIQRVSRNLVPLWFETHRVIPAVWNDSGGYLRRLDPEEEDRVLRWPARSKNESTNDEVLVRRQAEGIDPSVTQPGVVSSTPSLLVPWRSVVAMVEVPPNFTTGRLAALASSSGNKLVGIAYDAIPIVSADAVPPIESTKFATYLTAVKFAARMAGISAAATSEIGGFVSMLPTQGLVGPIISEVSLPSASPGPQPMALARATRSGRPTVLAVGSHEPRKNHLAVLFAAEVLWREGIAFELQFIGGSGWGDAFPRRAADLKALGRPVEVRKGVGDAELEEAMGNALFTVFPSLHEGYGLPVAESMAIGTPVITSNFGSMAEIGAAGGAVLIDSRDDGALVTAMRRLLTTPAEITRLRDEIAKRPHRGWDDYAAELWASIVQPELDGMSAGLGEAGHKPVRDRQLGVRGE